MYNEYKIRFIDYLYIIESITEFMFCLRIFLRICFIFVRFVKLIMKINIDYNK